MSDLIVYLPNHGYSDTDPIYVSWLSGIYYVSDKDQNSFKLATVSGGSVYVQYSTSITDGYVRYNDTTGTATISGLEHLEGELVGVTSGGTYLGAYTVSNGSITLTSAVTTYQIGKLYSMKIKSMRLELPNLSVTTQGKIKTIKEVEIRYIKSKNGKAGQEYSGTEYLSDLNAEFYTISKDAQKLAKGGYSPDGYIVIRSDEPYPFTVVSAMITFEVMQ